MRIYLPLLNRSAFAIKPSSKQLLCESFEDRSAAATSVSLNSGDADMAPTSNICPWPTNKTDLWFSTLRMHIYTIEQTSATPIAARMRQNIPERELAELLSLALYQLEATAFPSEIASKYEAESKIRQCMTDARLQHAIWLRQEGWRDVKITYACTGAETPTMLEDKRAIILKGGHVYHGSWCDRCSKPGFRNLSAFEKAAYPDAKQPFDFHAIMPKDLYRKNFKPRAAKGEITITINTYPAAMSQTESAQAKQERQSKTNSIVSSDQTSTDASPNSDGFVFESAAFEGRAETRVRFADKLEVFGETPPALVQAALPSMRSSKESDVPPEMSAGISDLRELASKIALIGENEDLYDNIDAVPVMKRTRSYTALPPQIRTAEEVDEIAEVLGAEAGTL